MILIDIRTIGTVEIYRFDIGGVIGWNQGGTHATGQKQNQTQPDGKQPSRSDSRMPIS